MPAANNPCALGPPPHRGSGSPSPPRLFLLARRRGIIDGVAARLPHMGTVGCGEDLYALVVDRWVAEKSERYPTHVAGVFRTFERALEFGRSLQLADHASARLIELAPRRFPFLLIEHGGFFGLDVEGTAQCAAAADQFPRLGPDFRHGEIHFNVFWVSEEYAPSPPGIDRMGALHHFHVVNETLGAVRDRVGFARGWSKSLGLCRRRTKVADTGEPCSIDSPSPRWEHLGQLCRAGEMKSASRIPADNQSHGRRGTAPSLHYSGGQLR